MSGPPSGEPQFFVPGEVLFLMEHDGEANADAIAAGGQDHPAIKDVASGVRIKEFRRTRHVELPQRQAAEISGDSRPQQSRYSLAVARLEDETSAGVSQAVSQMNGRLSPNAAAGGQGAIVRAVSPNWFATPCPQQTGTGGPGARPRDVNLAVDPSWTVKTPDTPFAFTLPSLTEFEEGTGKGVQVVVLDTAPSQEAFENALKTDAIRNHPILKSLLEPDMTLPSEHLQISYADDELFAELNKNEDLRFEVKDHGYTMSDHGLFVAGIIHSIAPEAKIHLIQVLNDYGVGTVESILWGLQTALNEWDGVTPLLVNMSLMLSVPLKGHPRPRGFAASLLNDKKFLERVGWPIEWICDHIYRGKALLVGAAGNDWTGSDDRPAARQPAAFANVIGVGALNTKGKPAEYTNLSDIPTNIGFMTFGGDVESSGIADPDKGVLGLYIGEFPDGTENTNGWARWSGSSFAAPILTAALALLRGLGKDEGEAVKIVRDLAPDLTDPVEQVFEVRQGP